MIFPQPKNAVYQEGSYQLKDYETNYDLVYLYEKYKNGNADVTLKLAEVYGEDRYDLTIDENGIVITYGSDCGIFRAVSSLRQLIRDGKGSVPYCEIQDEPNYPKRGYMLDISRGRMPKVDFICSLIDLLASLKYNEFELYTEGIVYKYSNFPEVCKDIDCLTPEELDYLDKYCQERFIAFIANQNSLGHLSHWLNRDEFLPLKVGPKEDMENNLNPSAVINPLLPESLEFMDKIYGSLLPHFSSDGVNIGLDEAFDLGDYETKEACEKYGRANVFMDWLIKLHDLIGKKYNKKIRFWADMIYNNPETHERIPEDAIALVWGYDVKSTANIERRCIDFANSGTNFYVCPGDASWVAFTGRYDCMSFNVRHLAELGLKYGAKGYLLTNWGSGDHAHFPVWTFGPAALAAQYAWNIGTNPGWKMNCDFIASSKKFVDKEMFDGQPLSELLYRLQRYYFLEPECVHCATFAGAAMGMPLFTPAVFNDFKLEEYAGEDFYFTNVIDYVKKCINDLNKLNYQSKWKDQAICNAKMVIFVSELNKLRVEKKVSDEKIDEILALGEEILAEYNARWDEENYPEGKQLMLKKVQKRMDEVASLRGINVLKFTNNDQLKSGMMD
ncbi:MAG: family 20 glycosylhydrolase [Clostridia bacterium]|nr:family 20 glycosylhydrolase [Clostridia bacterium]